VTYGRRVGHDKNFNWPERWSASFRPRQLTIDRALLPFVSFFFRFFVYSRLIVPSTRILTFCF